MTISETITDARKKKGLTQGELAEMIGVTQSDIARIESGRHIIRLDRLEQIAKALKIRIVIK